MAYLGQEGIIEFRRDLPEPVVVPALAVNKNSNYITVDYDDWILGEQLTLVHKDGNVQGYAFRDELDRIYFHVNPFGALSNANDSLISLSAVNTTKPVAIMAGSNQTQIGVLSSLVTSLTSVSVETRLRAWPNSADAFAVAASQSPWKIQGSLRRWELSRSAPEIDTGSLGEKFSSFTKSVLSGSGSLDFLVDLYASENQSDIDPILRLVQLTDDGSAAQARFYLKQASNAEMYDEDTIPMTRAYYFSASILITASSISASTDDIVGGSANFVTTGPIRLLSK